jgi:hypothetical protein
MKDRHFCEGLQIKGCHPGKPGEVRSRIVFDDQTQGRLLVWVIVK